MKSQEGYFELNTQSTVVERKRKASADSDVDVLVLAAGSLKEMEEAVANCALEAMLKAEKVIFP